MKTFKTTDLREISLEGMMVFGKFDNGQLWLDFDCLQDAELEPLTAQCKVQIMRDGNVYVTQLPQRKRNRAIFRDDNCSLSLGQNGKYYFVFTMPEEEVREMPQKLVQQAGNIAQKLLRKILYG